MHRSVGFSEEGILGAPALDVFHKAAPPWQRRTRDLQLDNGGTTKPLKLMDSRGGLAIGAPKRIDSLGPRRSKWRQSKRRATLSDQDMTDLAAYYAGDARK